MRRIASILVVVMILCGGVMIRTFPHILEDSEDLKITDLLLFSASFMLAVVSGAEIVRIIAIWSYLH